MSKRDEDTQEAIMGFLQVKESFMLGLLLKSADIIIMTTIAAMSIRKVGQSQ